MMHYSAPPTSRSDMKTGGATVNYKLQSSSVTLFKYTPIMFIKPTISLQGKFKNEDTHTQTLTKN